MAVPMSAATLSTQSLSELARAPASDVKKLGWRGVMRTVGREGRLLVTNHDQPEAVILSLDTYRDLAAAAQAAQAQQQSALDSLRQRFDERLAALEGADAATQLRDVFGQPPALQGQVRAGAGH